MIRLEWFLHPSGTTYFITPILLTFHKAAVLSPFSSYSPSTLQQFLLVGMHLYLQLILLNRTVETTPNFFLYSKSSNLAKFKHTRLKICFFFAFLFFPQAVLYQQKSLSNIRSMISKCTNYVGQSLSITYLLRHYFILSLNNNLFL